MKMNCKTICWIVGAAIGLVAFFLMTPGMFWLLALILAVVIGGVIGYALCTFICADSPETNVSGVGGGTGPIASGSGSVEPSSNGTGPVSTPGATQSGSNPPASESTKSVPAAGETLADTDPVTSRPVDVASNEEKSPVATEADTGMATPRPAADSVSKTAPTKASVSKPASKAPANAEIATATPVAGKAASPKTANGKSSPAKAPKAKAAGAVAAPASASNTGTQPAGLGAARNNQPDDLKKIKGIGPKLESMLNEMGFYHFDQIAGWTTDEVSWVDLNLKGFKGRVTRDTWVDQAGQLARGEETEFSKRVGKGGVY